VVQVIEAGNEAEQKQQYVRSLGADRVVAVGNGANDRLMLQTARLGIAVLEGEGSAVSAIQHADVVARSIYDAMGMLLIPQRLVATLRS
jgi:P-type E1-E2 ATPase